MSKATRKNITNADLGTMIPEKYEITAENTVKVSLRDDAGNVVVYLMDFADMVKSVNMATALLNSNVARAVRLAR